MIETTKSINNIPLTYKRRPGTKDRKHLFVMFTGVRPIHEYEFDGAGSAQSQGDWLWIRDDYQGQHTYHVCHEMDFSVEIATLKLIEEVRLELGYEKAQCTLMGFSKGGWAALYFGIKYGYPNIVAGVPQIFVGSYTKSTWPAIFHHMTTTGSSDEQLKLDNLLPDVVRDDDQLNRNIYLFSSEQDEEFASHLGPFLSEFEKYSNFNLVLTSSLLVDDHAEVVRYNLPLILSTIYALGEGVAPRYGRVLNGLAHDRQTAIEVSSSEGDPVVDFSRPNVDGGVIRFGGVAFLKGIAAPTSEALSVLITAEGRDGRIDFPVVLVSDKWLTSKYYEKSYCDYRYGRFVSDGSMPCNWSDLSNGTYDLKVVMAAGNIHRVVSGRAERPFAVESNQSESLLRIRGNPSDLVLQKSSIIGPEPIERIFTVAKSWIKNDRLHCEGTFAVRGIEIPDWKSVNYYLILRNSSNTASFRLGVGKRPGQRGLFVDGPGDYAHAYYATQGYRGVALSNVPVGRYEVLISMSHQSTLATVPTRRLD